MDQRKNQVIDFEIIGSFFTTEISATTIVTIIETLLPDAKCKLG